MPTLVAAPDTTKTETSVESNSQPVQTGIIREMLVQKVELTEGDGTQPARIRAKVQEADTLNLNGRVYPRSVLEREITKMNEELGRRPGAVDHPEGYSASVRDLGIAWQQVSWEGNDVWAEGVIIPTAAGKDLEAAVRAGVEVGMSSRGYGTSKHGEFNGSEALIIQDDYELYTFDAVTDPSVYTARVRAIESLDIEHVLANEPELISKLADAVQERMMTGKKDEQETVQEHDTTVTIRATDANPPEEAPKETPVVVASPATSVTVEPSSDEAEAPKETPAAAPAGGDAQNGEESVETPAAESGAENDTELTEIKAELESTKVANAALEEKLKKVSEAAEDALTAIAAIVNLIMDELGEQDFYDVASLAYMAQSLKRYANPTNDDLGSYYDNFEPGKLNGLTDAVKALVSQYNTDSIAAYKASKTEGHPFAAKLSESLKPCLTRADVDAKFNELVSFAESIAKEIPGGKGTTVDPTNPEEMTEGERIAIASRVSSVKPQNIHRY